MGTWTDLDPTALVADTRLAPTRPGTGYRNLAEKRGVGVTGTGVGSSEALPGGSYSTNDWRAVSGRVAQQGRRPVKRGVVVALAAAVLLTQAALALAQSSPARKPGRQMTCGDFLLVDDPVKPEMVYWAATRDPRGSLLNAVIDVDATDRIVPRLIERCREAPNEPFWQTVKAETGKLR